MISWDTIKDLHVIQKLSEILGRWFAIDIIYVDEFGKLQDDFDVQKHEFKSYLFKTQMLSPKGKEFLQQDIDEAIKTLNNSKDNVVEFSTFYPGVKGMITHVLSEGAGIGYVISYCYAAENFGKSDEKQLIEKMVSIGYLAEEAELASKKLPHLEKYQMDYLRELLTLYSDEIGTYQSEIAMREQRIRDLNSEVTNKYRYHHMIGKSKKMQQIYALLEKIATTESTILIQGENGTGKELVAKAIHYNSQRKDKLFVAQNCSAFNDNLLDSELFGHVKGAFTGAVKDKRGLFETADGGTLFLDEIGDTSLTMQVKLLRVLQEGTFLPVGATTPKKVNVRIIAATNKPLKEMIAKGEFREDLYYRINVINVGLPPLRERKEDVPLLVDHFLEKRCAEKGYSLKTISKKCMEKMLDYTWPGNIRELENEIERLVVLAGEDNVITPELLSSRILEKVGGGTPVGLKGVNTTGTLKEALEELEAYMIKEGLKRTNYNKSKLAKELGISRAGLIMKVDKYGLDKRKKAS
ncbi:MAG: sigma 54-interacting transcriptional regulator [Halobacteriovoraceae bacterium]|nr:sigma 54-interacting transcriptional regulator [Halobacteriovoraceae bacterium]